MGKRIESLFGIEYPVVQAPLFWNTSAELVASVSEAGGLGVLGPHAGQRTAPKNMKEFRDALRKEVQKTKQLTSKPFAVNLIPPVGGFINSDFTDSTLGVMIEEGVPVAAMVSFNLDIAIPYISRCHDAGIKVLYRDISPTVEQALLAEQEGIDAYVVTGFEEGGSLPRHHISTLVLVPQITDVLSIPVLAAGSIVSTKTADAMRALGAEGVYAGTRFIATLESPTADNVKEIMVKARSEDMIEVGKHGNECRIVQRNDGYVPDTIPGSDYYGMLIGDLSKGHGNVMVDEGVGAIHEILPAADVVRQLGAPFMSS